MIAPPHPHESERLSALRTHNILDSARELRFDRLVFQAAQIFRVPIATITLVDEKRQWFKAKVGLSASESPRDDAICAFAILQTEPLVIENAMTDARFAQNPHVTGSLHIRFYAGVSMSSEDGFPLGSFCVMDHQPRHATPAQIRNLVVLAREAEEYIRGFYG